MNIGFTGTQSGMTERQLHLFQALVLHLYHRSLLGTGRFHHGDCVGADAEAAIAWERYLTHRNIVSHPGVDRKGESPKRAFTQAGETRESRWYLDRNKDIVRECDLLVACPSGPEELRSGTWSTVREARRQGKPVIIVWP